MYKKFLMIGLLMFLLVGCGSLDLFLPTPVQEPVASAIPPTSTLVLLPTETRQPPIRDIQPTLAVTPTLPEMPADAPESIEVEDPLFIVQLGTPAQVTNFLRPELGCSYSGIAGQVFDLEAQPVRGLIVEVTGTLEGNPVLHLALSGGSLKLGPGGFEIQLADRPIASQGTLSIQIFDLGGNPLSDQVFFDTSAECDRNQILVNFTATKIDFSDIQYMPFISNK